VVVYTAIFGNYDTLRDQPRNPRVVYRCYGDIPQPSSTWKFVAQKRKQPTIQLDARLYKIISQHIVTDCWYSIWLDANNMLWDDPVRICEKWLANADIALFKHPHRSCVYEELKACIRYKKDDPQIMHKQVERYAAEGYPKNNGLYSTGFIARRNTPKVKKFNELWWGEVKTSSHRDQLSFPYVAWKTGIKVQGLPGNARDIVNIQFPHRPYKGRR